MLQRLAFSLLFVFATPATRADDWLRVTLISDDALDVILLIKPVAAPADEQFIGFELINKTDQPLHVSSAHYRLDQARITRRGDGRFSTSSLGSGNEYDLLWREGPEPPPERRETRIEPGVTRRLSYSSDYSLALLGWPQAPGFVVEASAHLSLSLRGGTHLQTPADGVPFRFEWVEPDERGLNALRERLKARLATPGDWLADAYFIKAALSWPQVVSAVSVDELLAAMRGRDQQREYLVRHLNTHHAHEPAVKDYYLRAIEERDRWALADLARTARDVNDPRYIDPLMEILRDDHPAAKVMHHDALRAVARQIEWDLADDPAALRRELAELTLPRCRFIAAGEIPPDDKWYLWQSEVADLAVTGEASLIPRLRPYLDRTDIIIDARFISAPNNGVSLRACDLAYNAILDLRGEQIPPRISLFQPLIGDVEALRRQRDESIDQLRRQIDSGAK